MRNLGPWIALAGLFVGAGLYLGLRARAVTPPGPAIPTPSSGSAPAPAPARANADVEREIRAAFDAVRASWKATCFDPMIARTPSPPTSTHELNVSVDATGLEILRAINDVRGQTRADVAACLRDQPFAPIRVTPAPGQSVNVAFTIRFP